MNSFFSEKNAHYLFKPIDNKKVFGQPFLNNKIIIYNKFGFGNDISIKYGNNTLNFPMAEEWRSANNILKAIIDSSNIIICGNQIQLLNILRSNADFLSYKNSDLFGNRIEPGMFQINNNEMIVSPFFYGGYIQFETNLNNFFIEPASNFIYRTKNGFILVDLFGVSSDCSIAFKVSDSTSNSIKGQLIKEFAQEE